MLRWALSVWVFLEIEKLNFGRKDSRVLRLLRRELAAAEDVATALLKEESAAVNLVPQTIPTTMYRPWRSQFLPVAAGPPD